LKLTPFTSIFEASGYLSYFFRLIDSLCLNEPSISKGPLPIGFSPNAFGSLKNALGSGENPVKDSWVGNAENAPVSVTCRVESSMAFRPDMPLAVTFLPSPGFRSLQPWMWLNSGLVCWALVWSAP
jgi:hypothetical protein